MATIPPVTAPQNSPSKASPADWILETQTPGPDGNSDGLTGLGELQSLASLGIASLNLQAEAGTQVDNGNILGLTSNWTGTNGAQHAMADVWFSSTSLASLTHLLTDPNAQLHQVL
jgi:hypothetical protein